MTAAPKTATLPRPRAEDAFLRGARTPRRTAAVFRALVCAAAICGLTIELATTGAPLELLSRFTFQANVAVAGVFGWSSFRSWTGRGPASPHLTGGALLVAVIIGLTYHLILTDNSFGYSAAGSPAAPPTGARAVSQALLHTALPVAVTLDWLLLTPARTLRLRFLPQWLLCAVAYLAFVLARGTLLAPDAGPRYPYPFLNVDTYGYSEVLAHAFALSLLLVVLASLLIALDHVRPRLRDRTGARR
ncbi:Pr6Pr family membrane protein [Streptomyces sp. NBC_00247]|uniref:Pr6Pr family membrane protein n=1 Tax=Streptomyces sp. NBC_00247 TaxID=2975689 RepID=UPI002E2A58E5|nr:Pr6Pr family membrane protein [Streptomyces sp. NBC_00247]